MSDQFRALTCPVCGRICGATDQRAGHIAVACKACREWRIIDVATLKPGSDELFGNLRRVISAVSGGVS